MNPPRMRCIPWLIGVCLASPSLHAEENALVATPYRPTVSNPAELSAAGWLELEAGWGGEHTDGSRQSLPYLAKLAFSEDWGIMLGGEMWIHQQQDGSETGFGDTSLILKHRIATRDEKQNFGFEAGIKLPTAKDSLGSGKSDYTLNGIYSLDFARDWRLDVNAGATWLGLEEKGVGDVSYLWAAALSTGVGACTLGAEVSGTHQAGQPDARQWMLEASYAVTPRLVLDGGVSLITQDHADGYSLFFGLTWLAHQLF